MSKFFKTKIGIIITNLFCAVLILAAVIGGTILWLRHYTQHGIEITVPNITGLYTEEAQSILTSQGLKLAIIDSTFSNKTALGTLLEQNPTAGSKVKSGRTIYAIQNARFRRPVIVPELRDLSIRQAESTIKNLGLNLGFIYYEPSTYKDIILDMHYENTPITAGTKIPEGSTIDLYVGKGPGNKKVTVPTVNGKTLNDVRVALIKNTLTIGTIEYDVEPTDENKDQYIVFSQNPEGGEIVTEGTCINIKLTTDIEKAVTTDNNKDEEDFF
jgi:beta-lactam-binding protein with PASTA domain